MALTDDQLTPRFRQQRAEIARYLPVSVGTRADEPSVHSYLYETGIVLIHQDDAERLAPLAGARPTGPANSTGYARFRTDDVPAAVDSSRTAGHGVWPNHVVSIARVGNCPADEPVPVGADSHLVPEPGDPDAGQGVSIRVLDTGLFELDAPGPADQPLPATVSGNADASWEPYGRIKMYAGHGSFIAGILNRLAPAATIRVTDELSWAGVVTEHELGPALEEVLAHDPPDIICLAAGTETAGGRLPALDRFIAMLREQHKTLLVAAAGNNGSEQTFYPAAEAGGFPSVPPAVLAVGALRSDGEGRACFSNHGDWVSVFAPGERLVNGFFGTGYYPYRHGTSADCRYHYLYPDCTCVRPAHHLGDVVAFSGRAQWSGTSFSTPIVAGLVAAHMSRIGKPAPEAALDLLRTRAEQIADAADQRPLWRILPPGYPPPPSPR